MRTTIVTATVMWMGLCGCGPDRRPRVPVEHVEAPRVQEAVPAHEAPQEPGISARPVNEATVGAVKAVTAARPEPKPIGVVIEELNGELQDAFFDYDRSALTSDGLSALRQDAALLVSVLAGFPQLKVTVEGHCDERGSAEYNLALGDDRASRAGEALQRFGVPARNLEVVSYGKERPQCAEPAESCWHRNRRAHLRVEKAGPTG